jgi:hypothetical protein
VIICRFLALLASIDAESSAFSALRKECIQTPLRKSLSGNGNENSIHIERLALGLCAFITASHRLE